MKHLLALLTLMTACASTNRIEPASLGVKDDEDSGSSAVTVEEGPNGECILHRGDGVDYFFPCGLAEKGPKAVLEWIQTSNSFFDNLCEGFDI